MATVTVYTLPNCTACTATKRALAKIDVEYTEIDLRADDAALAEMRALGWTQAPVVKVEDELNMETWAGYRPDLIVRLKKR